MSTLLLLRIDFMLIVDSHVLMNSFYPFRTSVIKSILADVSVIRYEFESGNVSHIMWVPGESEPPDPCTKQSSTLTDCLPVMLNAGKIFFSLPDCDIQTSGKSSGWWPQKGMSMEDWHHAFAIHICSPDVSVTCSIQNVHTECILNFVLHDCQFSVLPTITVYWQQFP